MTIHGVIARVPYPPKADIPSRKFVVRYVPITTGSGAAINWR
jgi:hypothetical protein